MYFWVFASQFWLSGWDHHLPSSSIFFFLLIAIGAALTGYHHNHRTNDLPSVVSEQMIHYAWNSPVFSRLKNRNAQDIGMYRYLWLLL